MPHALPRCRFSVPPGGGRRRATGENGLPGPRSSPDHEFRRRAGHFGAAYRNTIRARRRNGEIPQRRRGGEQQGNAVLRLRPLVVLSIMVAVDDLIDIDDLKNLPAAWKASNRLTSNCALLRLSQTVSRLAVPQPSRQQTSARRATPSSSSRTSRRSSCSSSTTWPRFSAPPAR